MGREFSMSRTSYLWEFFKFRCATVQTAIRYVAPLTYATTTRPSQQQQQQQPPGIFLSEEETKTKV